MLEKEKKPGGPNDGDSKNKSIRYRKDHVIQDASDQEKITPLGGQLNKWSLSPCHEEDSDNS